MTAYTLLKFLHVLLAIAAVGANITYGLWLARAAREPRHLEYVLRGVKVLDDRVANPSYALLFVTGAAMIYVGDLSWTTPWLLASLVLYAVVLLLGLLGYTPLLRRQIALLSAGGPASPEYRTAERRARLVGTALAVLVVAIVFLMVVKPGLW
ncbi:MAG: DUF2269 family protein [Armatimonadota bacterium]|nr:DUF2269 family protein [Armatimonadota bacterium]MDR7452243.1 DUF2269 family protein [Armatimonadota bacterium]MDR7466662.1 DUF2269 family protein [Armatimonadota bacterium]MDR7492864.1 DUF2269 family protein [Armatimonadota bacterium]MDR7498640.1 DUF2269 family protein [Armatimonadota bacterium]